MLENLLKYERNAEISIGQQYFERVTLEQNIGDLPKGRTFDFCMFNMNTGKLQLGNYDKRRNSRYGRPIKEYHNFQCEVTVK